MSLCPGEMAFPILGWAGKKAWRRNLGADESQSDLLEHRENVIGAAWSICTGFGKRRQFL